MPRWHHHADTRRPLLSIRERLQRNVKIGAFMVFIIAGLIGGIVFLVFGLYTVRGSVCTYLFNTMILCFYRITFLSAAC